MVDAATTFPDCHSLPFTPGCSLSDPGGHGPPGHGPPPQTSDEILFCFAKKHISGKIDRSSGCDNAKRRSASGGFASRPTLDPARGYILPDPRYRFALRVHHVPQTLALHPPVSLLGRFLQISDFIRYLYRQERRYFKITNGAILRFSSRRGDTFHRLSPNLVRRRKSKISYAMPNFT